ncbi:MAG: imidazoleglycerol-phosphate dehydratase HisB [Myxococcales bacterium]|nr:imidazoleglycerol-phosphate dehydratase HisB [Myxococcales bacterium]
MGKRSSSIRRNTKETQVALDLVLDPDLGCDPSSKIDTPVPFITHMLEAFARHGVFGMQVAAQGDIEVDPHHTVEDLGLCLGAAFKEALGDSAGVRRYGSATIPMDETLVTCAIDFCGRPAFVWKVEGLDGRIVGSFDCSLAHEFWAAFAARAECNLHVLLHHGQNPHHIIEAIFKACARACDAATLVDERLGGVVPSTKGTLSS